MRTRRSRGFGKLGCFLLLLAIGCIIGGAHGTWTALRNMQPASMSLKEYIDNGMAASWVKLSGVYVALPEAGYIQWKMTHSVTEVFVPLLPRGGGDERDTKGTSPSRQPIHVLIVSSSPEWCRLVSQLRTTGDNEKAAFEFLAKNLDTLFPKEPVEGLTRPFYRVDSKLEKNIREIFGSRLAADYVILDVGNRPQFMGSLFMLAIGVVIILAFAGLLRKPTFLSQSGAGAAMQGGTRRPAPGGPPTEPPNERMKNLVDMLISVPEQAQSGGFVNQRLPNEVQLFLLTMAAQENASVPGAPDGLACFGDVMTAFGSDVFKRELREIAFETGDPKCEMPLAADDAQLSPFGTRDLDATMKGFFLQAAIDTAAGRISLTPRGWRLSRSGLTLRSDVSVRLERANDLWHLYRRGVDAPSRRLHSFFTFSAVRGFSDVLSGVIMRADEAAEAVVKVIGQGMAPPSVLMSVPYVYAPEGTPAGAAIDVRGWATETSAYPTPGGIKVWHDPTRPHEFLVNLGIGPIGRSGGQSGAAAGYPETPWIMLVIEGDRLASAFPV